MFNIKSAAFSAVFFLSIIGAAQELQGPENLSLGGAGIGTNNNSDSHWLNPATLGFSRSSIMGFYGGSGGSMPASKAYSGWAVSAVDSNPAKQMPGAFTYSRMRRETESSKTFQFDDFQYAMAIHYNRQLAFGLSGRYSIVESSTDSSQRFYDFNGSLGIMGAPLPTVGLGAVITNVLGTSSDLPEHIKPTQAYGIGGHVSFLDVFRFRADWVTPKNLNPENLADVRVGLESIVRRFMSLRVGYAWVESKKAQEFSGGIAFVGPNLSVAYGFAQTQKTYGDVSFDQRLAGTRHMFDLWLPF